MTEEEKLRLRILMIKARKGLYRLGRKSSKVAKRACLFVGLFLLSMSAKSAKGQSLRESLSSNSGLIAKVMTTYKDNPQVLLAKLDEASKEDLVTRQMVNNTIDLQIDMLVGQLMTARTDSLLATIDRLDAARFRTSEIRRNFKSSIGRNPTTRELRLYCLASQCAADFRALDAMGLGCIIPKDLRGVAASTRGYATHKKIAPFVHKVKTNDAAIAQCIRENGLGVGTYVFYPRKGGSYHAMSVSFEGPEGEIKLSGANRQRKDVDISSKDWVKTRETLIIDMAGVYGSFIKEYLDGKTLDEQVAFLYHGGAEKFIEQLKRANGINEDPTLIAMADEGTLLDIVGYEAQRLAEQNPLEPQTANAAFLLALVPMAYKRRSGATMNNLRKIENDLSQIDEIGEAFAYLDKNLDKALANLSEDKKQQYLNSFIFTPRKNMEINTAEGWMSAYAFAQYSAKAMDKNNAQWHEVAQEKQPSTGKKKSLSPKKGMKKAHPMPKGKAMV